MAQLEEGLAILLRVWRGNGAPGNGTHTPDLAKIIQATLYEINQLNDANAAFVDGSIKALKESLDQIDGDLANANIAPEKIKELRDFVDAIPDVGEGKGLLAVRERIKSLGAASDRVSKLLKENPAAKAVDKLKTALDVADAFRTAGDLDLNPGNFARGMAKLIGTVNSLSSIPGVKQMLTVYVDALNSIASAIDLISDARAHQNLVTWENTHCDSSPGAMFGPVWAKEVLKGVPPEKLSSDPLTWENEEVPDELRPYLGS